MSEASVTPADSPSASATPSVAPSSFSPTPSIPSQSPSPSASVYPTPSATPSLLDNVWSQYQADGFRSGRLNVTYKGNVDSSFSNANSDASRDVTFYSTAPMSDSQHIYLPSMKGTLTAFNHQGKPVWEDQISTSPLVSLGLSDSLGLIIVVDSVGKVFGIKRDSELAWEYTLSSSALGAPFILSPDLSNFNITGVPAFAAYFLTSNGTIVALDQYGELIFEEQSCEVPPFSGLASSLTLAIPTTAFYSDDDRDQDEPVLTYVCGNSLAFFMTLDGAVSSRLFNPLLSDKYEMDFPMSYDVLNDVFWATAKTNVYVNNMRSYSSYVVGLQGNVTTSVSVLSNGYGIVGTSGGLYAINQEDGTIVWSNLGNSYKGNIAIDAHDTIFVGGSNNNVYSFDKNGKLLFSASVQGPIVGVSLSGFGEMFLSTTNGFLVGFEFVPPKEKVGTSGIIIGSIIIGFTVLIGLAFVWWKSRQNQGINLNKWNLKSKGSSVQEWSTSGSADSPAVVSIKV